MPIAKRRQPRPKPPSEHETAYQQVEQWLARMVQRERTPSIVPVKRATPSPFIEHPSAIARRALEALPPHALGVLLALDDKPTRIRARDRLDRQLVRERAARARLRKRWANVVQRLEQAAAELRELVGHAPHLYGLAEWHMHTALGASIDGTAAGVIEHEARQIASRAAREPSFVERHPARPKEIDVRHDAKLALLANTLRTRGWTYEDVADLIAASTRDLVAGRSGKLAAEYAYDPENIENRGHEHRSALAEHIRNTARAFEPLRVNRRRKR